MDQRNKTNVNGWARGAAVVALITLSLSGCASTPMAPTASLDSAGKAIATAEQSGARQYAGAELDEARHQLEEAKVAVIDERMIDAQRHAERAEVTAELASAKAGAAKADEINRQIRRSAEALDEEMQRTGEQQ